MECSGGHVEVMGLVKVMDSKECWPGTEEKRSVCYAVLHSRSVLCSLTLLQCVMQSYTNSVCFAVLHSRTLTLSQCVLQSYTNSVCFSGQSVCQVIRHQWLIRLGKSVGDKRKSMVDCW